MCIFLYMQKTTQKCTNTINNRIDYSRYWFSNLNLNVTSITSGTWTFYRDAQGNLVCVGQCRGT